MTRILYLERNGTLKGGGQESLLELIRHLDRSRFAPSVVVGEEGPLKAALVEAGADCAVIPFAPLNPVHLPAVAKSFGMLWRHIRQLRPAILHANDSRSQVYAGLISRRVGIPCLFHYRVSYSDGLYDRLLPHLCDRIIAVSNAAAARFKGFESRLRVVHNAVNPDRFPLRTVETRFPFRIGSVGRYGGEKGFSDLVRAFALLQTDFPGSELVLAGGGDDGEQRRLESLIRELNLVKSVALPGRINDMAGFYGTLDCFALLSENEGLNRSILEAMVSGVPVVATAVGGNPEVIEDGKSGLLVPYCAPEQAAVAIRRLLKDQPLRFRITAEARRVVMERFSIERHAGSIESVYDSLL